MSSTVESPTRASGFFVAIIFLNRNASRAMFAT
jgi:hypothetical protein